MKSEREKQVSYINGDVWTLEKMVQMNLFAGQKQRHGCRECTSGHGGKGRVGQIGRQLYIHY